MRLKKKFHLEASAGENIFKMKQLGRRTARTDGDSCEF